MSQNSIAWCSRLPNQPPRFLIFMSACAPGTVLNTLQVSSYLIFTTTQWDRY